MLQEKAGLHVTLSSLCGVEGSSRYCVFDRDIERASKATTAAHVFIMWSHAVRLGNVT